MKKKIKTMIGVLIFMTGISLFFYPDYREWKNQNVVREMKDDFQEIRRQKDVRPEEAPDETPGRPSDEAESEAEETDTGLELLYEKLQEYNHRLASQGQNITDAWSFRQTGIDIAALNNGSDVIGYLEIPDISLTLPLYIGASEENMAHGAVVLAETSMPLGGENTNCVIAAHRGWSGSPYFRDIDQLTKDSLIGITTVWGELIYQVTGTTIVHETDCSILNIQPGKDMVTLFSCYPYGAVGTDYRLAVFCERTDRTLDEEETEMTEADADNPAGKETRMSDIIEEELLEKGIRIEESPYQIFFDMEDQLRRAIPAALLLILVLVKTAGYRKGKKKHRQ